MVRAIFNLAQHRPEDYVEIRTERMDKLSRRRPLGTRNIGGIAPGRLKIEDLVKLRHFDPRIAESRRELLHGSLLPVGEERTLGAGVLMPSQ
jgi:hypothetical protein